jgi:hypothetical protein
MITLKLFKVMAYCHLIVLVLCLVPKNKHEFLCLKFEAINLTGDLDEVDKEIRIGIPAFFLTFKAIFSFTTK